MNIASIFLFYFFHLRIFQNSVGNTLKIHVNQYNKNKMKNYNRHPSPNSEYNFALEVPRIHLVISKAIINNQSFLLCKIHIHFRESRIILNSFNLIGKLQIDFHQKRRSSLLKSIILNCFRLVDFRIIFIGSLDEDG